MSLANADQHETEKFDAVAARWWDVNGPCAPLHGINPLRTQFITDNVNLANLNVIDIGCGGGILSEAMAKLGAHVTGVDAASDVLTIARLHAAASNIFIHYQHNTAEALAAAQPEHFDVVTCMEMLEHVPDPAAVIEACATLVKPGGWVFLSTLNRSPKAYLHAIVGAEYLLRLLPPGTHDYHRFIRPAELRHWANASGLTLQKLIGIDYSPLTKTYRTTHSVDVNYLAAFQRPSA